MPDDIRIDIKTDGAAQAEGDLKKVANAERAVGSAAQSSTKATATDADAKKKAAQATRETDDANRTLAERFRALSPEMALIGDAIDSLTLKQGGMASAFGIAGVAVLGLTMIFQKWQAASAEEEQRIQRVRDAVGEAAKEYLTLAESIEKATIAEQRRGGKDDGVATDAATRAALDAAIGLGLGPEVAQEGAIAMSAVGLTADEMEAYLMWVGLGYAEQYPDDHAVRVRVFRAQLKRHPDMAAKLRNELEARQQANRRYYTSQQTESIVQRHGLSPDAEIMDLLRQAGERRGRGESAEDLRVLVQDEFERMKAAQLFARDLKDPFGGPGNVPNPYGPTTMRLDSDAAQVIRDMPELGQMFGMDRFLQNQPRAVQTIFHYAGGTHYHNHDKRDPAGEPVERGVR